MFACELLSAKLAFTDQAITHCRRRAFLDSPTHLPMVRQRVV